MGCCFSCFNSNDNKSQSGEPNERTTLLGNPVSNNIGRPLFSQDFPEVVSGQVGDEQAALSKILHQTAIDIIDVSAIPTHVEQKDYIDRVKLYQKRLLTMPIRLLKNDKYLLKDLPLSEKNSDLAEALIAPSEILMINELFEVTCRALENIKIEPQEDLVSKFDVS